MSEDFEAPKDDLDKELPAGSEEHSDYKPADAKDANIKHQLSGMYQNWFLDYASYVILERAVPHIMDGLKPVQRRILHSMRRMEDGRYNKVANIVGHTMQFHPHGDASIGDALGLALKNLREEKEKNNKAIILLTDGENNDGSLSMAQAIGLAEKEGIKIYTVGVGSDRNFLGSLFGLGNGELDEKSLKELAQRTKGNYFRATDVNSLAEIYTKIDQLEPAKSEGNIVQEKKDLFYIPLTFALILTLFLLFLPGRYLK